MCDDLQCTNIIGWSAQTCKYLNPFTTPIATFILLFQSWVPSTTDSLSRYRLFCQAVPSCFIFTFQSFLHTNNEHISYFLSDTLKRYISIIQMSLFMLPYVSLFDPSKIYKYFDICFFLFTIDSYENWVPSSKIISRFHLVYKTKERI